MWQILIKPTHRWCFLLVQLTWPTRPSSGGMHILWFWTTKLDIFYNSTMWNMVETCRTPFCMVYNIYPVLGPVLGQFQSPTMVHSWQFWEIPVMNFKFDSFLTVVFFQLWHGRFIEPCMVIICVHNPVGVVIRRPTGVHLAGGLVWPHPFDVWGRHTFLLVDSYWEHIAINIYLHLEAECFYFHLVPNLTILHFLLLRK